MRPSRDAYKRSEAKGITEEPAFRSSSSKIWFCRRKEKSERKKGNKKHFESRKNRINVDSEDESIDQQTKEEKEEDKREGFSSADDDDNDYDHCFMERDRDEPCKSNKIG